MNAAEAADYDRLLAATRFAIRKQQWQTHLDALDKALCAAAGLGEKARAASNFERILSQRTPSLMLAQATAIRALTADRLGRLCSREETAAFIDWLFTHPQALPQLAAALKPQDKLDRAIEIWRDIWRADPDGREEFMSLAIAVALVFDQPVPISMAVYGLDAGSASSAASGANEREVNPVERYRFYRDSAKRGVLKTDLAELAPYELVWVVDAPVPASELVWAQKKINLARRAWDRAYSMIRYRMDKASGRRDIYKKYTLEEILREGGICGDQAYFAAITAKAFGIPAMVIAGQGERGGHAWFGYKASSKEWNLEAGRYTSDNFVAGTSSDPQVRVMIKEHELKILADPQRRAKGWQASERLVQLAAPLGKAPALARLALETALEKTPRYFEGWVSLLEFRAAQKPAAADWQKEIQRARANFKDYPDLIEKLNAIEIGYLKAGGSIDLARKAADRQTRSLENKSENRSDLVLDSLDREVELADKTGDKDKARRLYRRAMSDAGDSLVQFKALAPRYYKWGKQNGLGSEAAHDIKRSFEDINFSSGDMFAMQAYLSAINLVVDLLEKENMTREASRLKKTAAKIEESLKALKNNYGGNRTK